MKYRDFKIVKSGKRYYKIFRPNGDRCTYQRYGTVDGCKAIIDAVIDQRTLTEAERERAYQGGLV